MGCRSLDQGLLPLRRAALAEIGRKSSVLSKPEIALVTVPYFGADNDHVRSRLRTGVGIGAHGDKHFLNVDSATGGNVAHKLLQHAGRTVGQHPFGAGNALDFVELFFHGGILRLEYRLPGARL